jgi:hypothetical protein
MRGGKGEYEISRPATNRALSREKRPSRFECRIPESGECFCDYVQSALLWFLLEWIFAHRQLPGICARATAASPSVEGFQNKFLFQFTTADIRIL